MLDRSTFIAYRNDILNLLRSHQAKSIDIKNAVKQLEMLEFDPNKPYQALGGVVKQIPLIPSASYTGFIARWVGPNQALRQARDLAEDARNLAMVAPFTHLASTVDLTYYQGADMQKTRTATRCTQR
jgi:hypothetical protein